MGSGLFFMGLNLLTQHLKALTNRRVRQSAAKWTSSRWSGCLWGVLAGAVAQTMPALTFVTIGMLRSGILTPRRAFPILVGGKHRRGHVVAARVVRHQAGRSVRPGGVTAVHPRCYQGTLLGSKTASILGSPVRHGDDGARFRPDQGVGRTLGESRLGPGVCGAGGALAGPVPADRYTAVPRCAVVCYRDGNRDRPGDKLAYWAPNRCSCCTSAAASGQA